MSDFSLSEFNSPFSKEQADALRAVLPGLNREQQLWLSGFLAAGVPAGAVPASQAGAGAMGSAAAGQGGNGAALTVLYGTETGNSRTLAQTLKERAESAGYQVQVEDLADFKPKKLKELDTFAVITSTHGEGDPPEPIKQFYEYLHSKRAPKLAGKRYSVLALGDSSYEHYCQTGRDVDTRLEELGADRISDRVDCDVDFDEDADAWIAALLDKLGPAAGPDSAVPAVSVSSPSAAPSGRPVTYSRKNPFPAEVLENINLNDEGSSKITRHLELSLEGSGLTYTPGDALGIIPRNHPEDVDRVISFLELDPEEMVPGARHDEKPLREALIEDYEITRLTPPVLKKYAELSQDGVADLLREENRDRLRAYIHGRGLIDLLQDFGPGSIGGRQLVELLRRMPARLYSIASSLRAYPDEVHLTVALDEYDSASGRRYGVCSRQCHEHAVEGELLPVYVQENTVFRLPADPARPIIMVGPGTGVAPFRAFMQEREEIEAEGPSWLIFGDRNFRTDFLYQAEWQKWLADGVLTRMDVAFSRDQAEKVYVQDRLRERARDVYAWLEDGACFYVCGDEQRMAPDVHEALIGIVQSEGGRSREAAEDYVESLKADKRYLRDVY